MCSITAPNSQFVVPTHFLTYSIQVERSISGFLGHQLEVKEMLNLIVSAYLIFDPQGKGYIERSGIEKTLDEHGNKGNHKSNAVLSQQRWAEMVSGVVFVLVVLILVHV